MLAATRELGADHHGQGACCIVCACVCVCVCVFCKKDCQSGPPCTCCTPVVSQAVQCRDTHSVWKKRKVFLVLLEAFTLELLLMPPRLLLMPLLVLAVFNGVHAGEGCRVLTFDLGVAGTLAKPAAASCHGLGFAGPACTLVAAAVAAALAPDSFAPSACDAWPALSLRLPAADAELRVGALKRAGGSFAPEALAVLLLLPEAGLAATDPVASLGTADVGRSLCAVAAAAAAGLSSGSCLLLAVGFFTAASTPRCPTVRLAD